MASSITATTTTITTMLTGRKRSNPETEAKLSCDAEPASLVNFNDTPPSPADVITLPKDNDDLGALIGKLGALADVVSRNRSLALWTGFAATPNPKRDPIDIAKAEADPRELEMFAMFDRNGRRLPESSAAQLDVARDVKPLVRENAKTAARYEDMASCVDEVFGTRDATKENVCWIVENMEAVLPLVKFHLRVKRARRNLSGGLETLTSNELAEYQTVRKIRSVLGVRMQKCRAGSRCSDKRLSGYDAVLLRRQNIMSCLVKGQREGQMRTGGVRRENEQLRVKRQRCAA
ncbi:hypothetical protein CTA2_2407 [Colletotrichum tanaceti]|uniref:Uncharacterized protein n=1 Tax=Colletotrichum tanaceti TaxID=1306861 RepID=A0A4U6XWU7_9PEZI|nr:hypothetical protein CTA2_2407 [Colletotrichum tanaceti]TKW60269.1 hypothetical protein CTA1_4754 [Colletotrichum tanaceti]